MSAPLCSPTQEREMLREYANRRSSQALEQLVLRYRPLARSLALRYRGGSESVEDLFQVAELGLVKAIQGFRPERGKPFTAYAVPTILGEIKRHFRDRVWNLRLPRTLGENAMAVASARDRLTETLGHAPSNEEVADELELKPQDVDDADAAAEARATVSLEAPRGDEEGASTALDLLGTEESGYDRVEADFASSAAELADRERVVLGLRFEHGLTQSAIGERLGISQMQVSRISRSGLDKLLTAVRGGEKELA